MIGQQKKDTTQDRQELWDGKSEGYRKALRFEMAEKFGIPVDTYRYPGAYPGLKLKNVTR
jgi:acetyl-CoA carboxylase alpha subunit